MFLEKIQLAAIQKRGNFDRLFHKFLTADKTSTELCILKKYKKMFRSKVAAGHF